MNQPGPSESAVKDWDERRAYEAYCHACEQYCTTALTDEDDFPDKEWRDVESAYRNWQREKTS